MVDIYFLLKILSVSKYDKLYNFSLKQQNSCANNIKRVLISFSRMIKLNFKLKDASLVILSLETSRFTQFFKEYTFFSTDVRNKYSFNIILQYKTKL